MQGNQTENFQEQSLRCVTLSPSGSPTSQLIREWLFRFGVNFEKDVAAVLPVWLEAFGEMEPRVLETLFKKALATCKFFPRVADILEHGEKAKSAVSTEAGEEAWQWVLEIRRRHWNPDIPGPFDRALAALHERVRRAARASGIFRDFTATEWESGALHTWAKKKYLESFAANSECEQDTYLLPEGEIKNLLADLAETKALPAPQRDFAELHARGWEYSANLKQGTPAMSPEARLLAADQLAEAARQVNRPGRRQAKHSDRY